MTLVEIPEGSELANMVANLAAKNDANLALPPRFRQVLIVNRHYNCRSEAQWLRGSVSGFHATGPRFKSRAAQGRLSLSSLQWIDK
ncbi:hypothetical protein TNCV_4015721 [Trichonephila clavipes]|nr:hypothetical protein TNCV_4015721 [Trichonephila clavipes]